MIEFQHGPVVLTEKWIENQESWLSKEFKRIDMSNLKLLEINFKGWYCPISQYVFMINWDGSINSGICANVMHTTPEGPGLGPKDPWWNKTSLEISDLNTCNRVKGDCFCDADIYMPKAIDKKVFDWFTNNKPSPDNFNTLPLVEEDDHIIAMSNKNNISAETHFHIGKRCNFNCSYCSPIWVHDNYSPDMSMQYFKHALNLIEPHMPNNKRLILTGGEPTLNPKLFDMIKYAKEDLNYDIFVSTNGTASITKMTDLLEYGANLQISFHMEFTKEILVKKIATLAEKYKDQIQVKIMSLPNTEFAQFIDSILPGWIDIHHYPIYGQDIIGGNFNNIQPQTFAEMKQNVRIN